MSLREAIERAMGREEVPAEVLEAAFGEIAAGRASEIEITALLVALRTKGETQREIVAADVALRTRFKKQALLPQFAGEIADAARA